MKTKIVESKTLNIAKLPLAVSIFLLSNTPVFANESTSDADSLVLEEVIVMAQRREQSILEVPVAISTISADALDKQQVDNIYDLMITNTSVSGISDGGLSAPLSNTPVRIRGIGTSGSNPGFESAVGLYVDDVYRSRPGAAMVSFFDMAGVDILRGPQGTLFGKNSTSGAIIQRTAAPETGEFEAYVAAQYAEYNSVRFEGAVNIPLAENSAIRISGLNTSTDGFFEQAVTGDDTFADSETQALRFQFASDVSEDLSIRLMADWSDFSDSGAYGRATRINDFENSGANAFFASLARNTEIGGLGYYYDDPNGDGQVDPFSYIGNTNRKQTLTMEQVGFAAHVDYDISDTISVRSITSYRDIEGSSPNGDFDFGPTSIAGTATAGGLTLDHDFDTISQELLFNFDYERADIVAGVHYFAEDITFGRTLFPGPASGVLLPGGTPGDPVLANPEIPLHNVQFDQTEESYGVFGHLTYNLTDQLDFIGGVRWNRIEKDISFVNRFGTPSEYHDAATNGLRFWYIIDAVLATAFPWENSLSNEEFTYDASLQWRPTDDLQLYAKYSHGFKAGGFNMNYDAATGTPSRPDRRGTFIVDGREFAPLNPDGAIFEPEFVDTYEIGARWNYGRGLLSATAFYSDFDDLQVTLFLGDVFVSTNAGSVTSQGFEFEGTFAATSNLSFNAAFTVLDTEYGDDVVNLPPGRAVSHAPELSVSVGVDYEQQLSDNLGVFASLTANYADDQFLNDGAACVDSDGNEASFSNCDPNAAANEITFLEQEAYTLVNANIGLSFSEDIDVSLYCTNCFEEEYLAYGFPQPAQAGSIVGYQGAPRVVGARIKASF